MLALLGAGVAIGVALRRLFGRRARGGERLPAGGGADPRAEALRARLAATRDASGGARPGPGETQSVEAAGDVEDARKRVHERGRAAVEEMRRSGDRQGTP